MTAEMAQGVTCGASCDRACGCGMAVLCELKYRLSEGKAYLIKKEVLGKLCKYDLHVQCKSTQQSHLAELPRILLSNVGDAVEAHTANKICFFYLAIKI